MNISSEDKEWMIDIIDYLTKGNLLEDTLNAKVLRTKTSRYAMMSGDFYWQGFSTPLLTCLTGEQAEYVIRELHEGICRMHLGS